MSLKIANCKSCSEFWGSEKSVNVVDTIYCDANPNSTYHPDAAPDADSDFYLTRIRTFIWCGCGSGLLFDADADPYSTFHLDADPDPDSDPAPSFQVKAQTLEKVLNRLLVLQTFWLVICKLMRIRIRSGFCLSLWCRFGCGSRSWFLFDAEPDAYSDPDFYLMRIQDTKHADPLNIYHIS